MVATTSDVSVRVAWADDATAIATVQRTGWLADGVLPEAIVAATTVSELAQTWREALTRPGDARNRVLVALAHDTVVGFAVLSPAADPDTDPIADAEITEFTVSAVAAGHGHPERLQQACIDTLIADKFQRALVWVATEDDAQRAFFSESGWAADGAHRTLDLIGDGSVTIKQVRLHTALT